MQLKFWSIFGRTILKQLMIVFLLAAPVLIYVMIADLEFPARNPGLYLGMVSITLSAMVVIMLAVKYISMRPLLHCLQLLKDGSSDAGAIQEAVSSCYRSPLADAVQILVCGLVIDPLLIIGPFAVNGLIGQTEAIMVWGLLLLTGIVLMPIYYLFAESEGRRFLKLPGVTDTIRLDSGIRTGISRKLILCILPIICYPTGILTLSILCIKSSVLAGTAGLVGFVLLIVVSIALSLIVAILLAGSIATSIREAAALVGKIGAGDLDVQIAVTSRDEVGVLAQALTAMSDQLSGIVIQVSQVADHLAQGSEELNGSAQQVSQGATEQATAAEQVSSSMEQMDANIQRNADNSLQTEKSALKAAQDAATGGESVSLSVNAMKQIASKIMIIEEIARNTNLLALNAAIEAARAGEHGRGFAIVASEVRKLAERSQKAAAEISELARSSVEIAVEAGEMFRKIVPDIKHTAELVQEIAAATREQNAGVEQIHSAITQLDQVVQQNAGSSEELASMSEELASQAEQLQRIISFFKITA